MAEEAERQDVLIVGGGLVGLALGCALGRAGLVVTVVDLEPPDNQMAPAYDGRASALSAGSVHLFRNIGLWNGMAAEASPIFDIRVADGHPLRGVSPLFLHYDHRALGDEPFGYVVENRVTRWALRNLAANTPNLQILAPCRVEKLDQTGHEVKAVLGSGDCLCASVAVAADGKFSPLREAAGIRSARWTYDQTAIVCTVAHERNHQGVAVELFMPNGPFAMLPMTNQRSNIIWSEKTELAQQYLALGKEAFLEQVRMRFGGWLGDIQLTGPRFGYPLSLSLAERYTDGRLVLAGDAAHAIHPIAGQGYNLGLRDVAALAEVLTEAKQLGLDLGSPEVLRRYERWRRVDNVFLAAVCDGLLRLFSNDIPPLRLARGMGLATVDRLPFLKKVFMRHAMGLMGDLPRLMRAE